MQRVVGRAAFLIPLLVSACGPGLIGDGANAGDPDDGEFSDDSSPEFGESREEPAASGRGGQGAQQGGRGGSGGTGGQGGAGGGAGVAGQASAGRGGQGAGGVAGAGGGAAGGRAGSGGTVATGGMGGISASGGIGGAPPQDPTANWKKTIVAVGYGGLRVASQDGGLSWKRLAQLTRDGGDDRELLRSIAYGKGRWVSAGWRMFTSTNGTTWTEGTNPQGCGIMEGAAYGNGTFVGTCGDDAFLSADGLTWRRGGDVGNTNGHTYVLFADGKFAASGDSGASFSSTDGQTWTSMPGINKVRYCTGAFRSESQCAGEAWTPNQFFRGAWKGKIERSATGAQWTLVYTDEWENTVYRFGEGLMPSLP